MTERAGETTELVIGAGRRDAGVAVAIGTGLAVGCVTYVAVLGARGMRLWLAVAWVVALLAPGVVLGLVRLGGRPAALTSAGVRLRVHPHDRRTVVVPWAEISTLWIDYVDRRRFLCLQPHELVGYLNGVRGRRRVQLEMVWERHGTPLRVHLPATGITGGRLADAVAALSGAAVVLADNPTGSHDPSDLERAFLPEPGGDRRTRPRRDSLTPLPRSVVWMLRAVVACVVVIGTPPIGGIAQPWHQPWWP